MHRAKAANGPLGQKQGGAVGKTHTPTRCNGRDPALLKHPGATPASTDVEESIDLRIEPSRAQSLTALLIRSGEPSPTLPQLR
jgi:hypothetical protein